MVHKCMWVVSPSSSEQHTFSLICHEKVLLHTKDFDKDVCVYPLWLA